MEMTLAAYLAARNESKPDFSRRSRVPYRTIHRACVTGRCGGRNAVLISRATQLAPTNEGGWVPVERLVAASGEASGT